MRWSRSSPLPISDDTVARADGLDPRIDLSLTVDEHRLVRIAEAIVRGEMVSRDALRQLEHRVEGFTRMLCVT